MGDFGMKGKSVLHKDYMSRGKYFICGRIKAKICMMNSGISNLYIRKRSWFKYVRGVRA